MTTGVSSLLTCNMSAWSGKRAMRQDMHAVDERADASPSSAWSASEEPNNQSASLAGKAMARQRSPLRRVPIRMALFKCTRCEKRARTWRQSSCTRGREPRTSPVLAAVTPLSAACREAREKERKMDVRSVDFHSLWSQYTYDDWKEWGDGRKGCPVHKIQDTEESND